MKLMGTEITLTRARQIIIADPGFESFSEEQAKKKISKIRQQNETIAHFF